MFWKRVISAIILIPVIIFLVWWGGYPYSIAIILVSGLMLIEFWGLSQSIGGRGGRIFTVACGVLFCLSAVDSIGFEVPVELALALTLLLPFSHRIFRDQVNVAFLSVASTLLGAVYIGWAFGHHLILLAQPKRGWQGLNLLLASDYLARRYGCISLRQAVREAQAASDD